MLDEFLEFEEYTCDLNNSATRRFHYSNITEMNGDKGVYAGVPRALRIISRFAYYHADLKYKNDEERINAIIHILKVWCGFEDDTEIYGIKDIKELSHIQSWLQRYVDTLESKNGKTDKTKLLDDLNKRCKENWERSPFQESGKVNDQYSIYFEKIIAEAIAEGPLKKYCLTFKKDPIDDNFIGKEGVLYDRGLKMVAAYLLNRIPESDYAAVDFATYSNWVLKGCTKRRDVTTRVIGDIKYKIDKKDVQIIKVEYMDYSNPQSPKGPMLRLDKDWENKYKPEIIPYNNEEELEKIKKEKKHVFVDKGCNFELERV